MMSVLPDVLGLAAGAARNIYGAGDGSIPPSAAAAAISQLLWNMHYRDGLAWGQNAYDFGGGPEDVEASFKRGFADSLGWSDAEFDAFWNDPNYEFTPEGAERFDQTYDDFYRLVENLRRGR